MTPEMNVWTTSSVENIHGFDLVILSERRPFAGGYFAADDGALISSSR